MSVLTFLRTPVRRRSFQDLAYALVGLPLAVLGFYGTLVFLGVGLLLSITVIGLPLIVLVLMAARGTGRFYRRLAGRLLGEHIEEPGPVRRQRRGYLGWLQARLGDPTAWRAVAYLLLRTPVALLAAAATAVFWVEGVIATGYPLLWAAHLDRPAPTFGALSFDHYPIVLTMTPIGLVLLQLAPWVVRGVLWLDRLLMRWLLSPSQFDRRVRDLEQSRASAVDDSAATLRRIERDLHDGAQARLVALGMNLTLLREGLDREEPARLRELVDTAATTAKEAIAELRDLVRGIHPPVLDQGLGPALSTLASRSAVPVQLTVDVRERPSAAIETIAYFCAAELLTNVTRHARARHATLEVTQPGELVLLRVSDDGAGGALAGTGTGLTGLTERVRTVDGRLQITSPPGGPTVVAVELPTHA